MQSFADRGVELIKRGPREGKAAALNAAVKHARGDIIVFSDANSLFAPDGIRKMVQNFADPRVGYVTGNLELITAAGDASGGGNAYLRYEKAVRSSRHRRGRSSA